jgi:hypothetical protein
MLRRGLYLSSNAGTPNGTSSNSEEDKQSEANAANAGTVAGRTEAEGAVREATREGSAATSEEGEPQWVSRLNQRLEALPSRIWENLKAEALSESANDGTGVPEIPNPPPAPTPIATTGQTEVAESPTNPQPQPSPQTAQGFRNRVFRAAKT